MAPIDPANTARLFVDYVFDSTRHTVIFRKQTADTMAALTTWANDWLEDHKALFQSSVSFDGARVALQNSNVTNPTDWTTVTGTGGSGSTDKKPRFGSFVGRDAQGHRTKLTFFGIVYSDDPDYRVYASTEAMVQAAVDDLNSLTAAPGSIVGSKPVWKEYLNLGYNAYWQRQARKG
jgi:hypothetical protein